MRASAVVLLIAAATWAAFAAAQVSDTASATAIIQQPRPFGYVLGDVLTQRILLESAGKAFEPAALPAPERVGVWLSRRISRIETTGARRWLRIDYQLINAPPVLMTTNLPALQLKSRAGPSLSVPEWPISIAPLTPRQAFAKGGLQDLLPDHPAPRLATAVLWRNLEVSCTALGVTVLCWLGWWAMRGARAAANQPFARALAEIRRGEEHSPKAWLALHRAFDRTAGQALQLDTLPALFRLARQFEPERQRIERFYGLSNERFFATGASDAASSFPLRDLCAALRRIEKRHER